MATEPPSIDISGAPVIGTIDLPKTGGKADLILLDERHAVKIAAMNDIITESLPAHQKAFILNPKPECIAAQRASTRRKSASTVPAAGAQTRVPLHRWVRCRSCPNRRLIACDSTELISRSPLQTQPSPTLFLRLIDVTPACVRLTPSSPTTVRTDEVRVAMVGGLRSRSLGFLAGRPRH